MGEPISCLIVVAIFALAVALFLTAVVRLVAWIFNLGRKHARRKNETSPPPPA